MDNSVFCYFILWSYKNYLRVCLHQQTIKFIVIFKLKNYIKLIENIKNNAVHKKKLTIHSSFFFQKSKRNCDFFTLWIKSSVCICVLLFFIKHVRMVDTSPVRTTIANQSNLTSFLFFFLFFFFNLKWLNESYLKRMADQLKKINLWLRNRDDDAIKRFYITIKWSQRLFLIYILPSTQVS